MPALYPMMSAAEDFRPGDCVRKFITDRNVTPFIGVVCQIVPATQKVWVQWPTEKASESPETLIKVNPLFAGFPVALTDMGYSSYETSRSEKQFGPSPLRKRTKQCFPVRVAFIVKHPDPKVLPVINKIDPKVDLEVTDVDFGGDIKREYLVEIKGKIFDQPFQTRYSIDPEKFHTELEGNIKNISSDDFRKPQLVKMPPIVKKVMDADDATIANAILLTILKNKPHEVEKAINEEIAKTAKLKAFTEAEKMAVRIAHVFAFTVINKLIDEVCSCYDEGLSDIKAYDKVYRKFGSICSDHIIRMSVNKVYKGV